MGGVDAGGRGVLVAVGEEVAVSTVEASDEHSIGELVSVVSHVLSSWSSGADLDAADSCRSRFMPGESRSSNLAILCGSSCEFGIVTGDGSWVAERFDDVRTPGFSRR